MAKQSQKVAAFIQGGKRKPPPDQWWKQPIPRMPGPRDPGPNDNQTFLGSKAANAGAYRIPGFGDWAKQKNIAKYRQRHAFSPKRNSGTWS